jgi:hypothetical protein
MMNKMMQKFPLFIGMGFMIVMIAVIIGAVNTANSAAYYAVEKGTRDTSASLAQLRASIESTVVWLPYFKFLGLAMILAGIIMALGVISLSLENLGKEVMSSVPNSARHKLPGRPRSVMLMRLFMMLGMMIILIGFFIALSVSRTAAAVFSNPITVIDAAANGSSLLANLASIHAAEAWLEAFKFVGVAFFFLGIINGLSTIIFALKYQLTAIPEVVDHLPAGLVPVPAVGD